jgi:hypothetical protein
VGQQTPLRHHRIALAVSLASDQCALLRGKVEPVPRSGLLDSGEIDREDPVQAVGFIQRIAGVNTDPDADRRRVVSECATDLVLDRLRACDGASSARKGEQRSAQDIDVLQGFGRFERCRLGPLTCCQDYKGESCKRAGINADSGRTSYVESLPRMDRLRRRHVARPATRDRRLARLQRLQPTLWCVTSTLAQEDLPRDLESHR